MKRIFLSLAIATSCLAALTVNAAPKIRLDTVGYLPDKPKDATIAEACTNFAVLRVSDHVKVLDGSCTGPLTNADTAEKLWTADFSALKTEGDYELEVPGVGRSAPFRVAADVYRQPYYTVMRGMYLWRCGTAVHAVYKGETYSHEICHTNDGWLDCVGGGHVKKEALKGWHDAGDYNKYVVNAGITVGSMFRAWEDFGPQLRAVSLDLPESGGKIPDFLAEIQWEMDWLLTMQAEDGSVYDKLSAKDFCKFILPENELDERFFVSWSSAATADFVAMTAQAARHFRPFDAAYADRCLSASKKSYAFLIAHPENRDSDHHQFLTGAYTTRDSDDRLWAAVELWETTGQADALSDAQARIRNAQARVPANFDWGDVSNLGLFTYLSSQRSGRDDALVGQVRTNLLATADGIVKTCHRHGYARPMGERYYWGGNGGVARQTLILQAAWRATSRPEYRDTALDSIHYLLGRNGFGRSFVTGVGDHPPLHPHDRRSGADKVEAPWPGYLVGGPNPEASDWEDNQENFRVNEIAINWNSALIYALAGFLK